MTQQPERPSDKIARRYSLPDHLKRDKPQGFDPVKDFRERQRRKKEASGSD